ncbi:MAG: chemotaxis protein CheW [Magnetococcales bacterium]|nr:chemotaxis protein CheW [Magnetococcales bacterium]
MSEEDDELLGMFVQEAVEHLETIEPDLLTLEENGSATERDIINRLFRGVHSIKGSAGFFGLTAITKLSHTMENLLGKVRDDPNVASPAVTDSLLAGLDKLQTMIGDVSSSESVDASEQVANIQALLAGLDGGAAPAATKPAPPEPPPAEATTEPLVDAEPPLPESAAAEGTDEEPPAEPGDSSPEMPEAAATTSEPPPDAADEVTVLNPTAPSQALTLPPTHVNLKNLELFPEAVTNAVHHGQLFFVVKAPLPKDADEKRSHYAKIKALMESVGQLVATNPDIAKDPGLTTVSEVMEVLLATVLEADLLQTLLQIPRENFAALPIPDSLTRLAAALRPQLQPDTTAIAAASRGRPAPSAALHDTTALTSQPADDDGPTDRRPRLRKPSAGFQGQAKGGQAKTASATTAATNPTAGKGNAPPAVEETLRVSVSLLDELINMAGELVLARNQLTRAATDVASQHPSIGPLVQNLDSITSRIQEKVMQARMQPVSVVFNKFPRIIRDLARKLEKKIDLELRGGDVDLDKSVIEHLSDPLTHMIRNVADHAIESPEDRIAIGKPEAGRVELAAYHENGMVNIALSDDGAGIDGNKIKMKAIEKGQITEEQADAMSEEEALNLIFMPGLSMAKKVSDVSGRGVGMDVVRTNIEKLGGTVHIESKVGRGTRIILKLPLTLAIIPAMIVSSGSQRFAIPEIGLVEIVRVAESDRSNQIETVGNAPVLRLRNMLLPLVDLADVLGIQRTFPPDSDDPDRRGRLSDRRTRRHRPEEPAATPVVRGKTATPAHRSAGNRRNNDDRRHPGSLVAYVMVLNVGGNEFGMVVDEVLDSEEIVVKPLPSFFKDNVCFSATTILGDGTVSLIIDYAGVMERANISFSNVERATRMDLDAERREALRERQNIILLETDTGLLMGIVHSMVRRVEKISPNLLVNIGGLPYVRYDRKTFRAVYPDQVMGLEGMGLAPRPESEDEDNDLCMVVPNIPDIQAGLIFARIIDTREINIELDTRAIVADGLFGSAQLDDRVVLFPDVNRVLDLARITTSHLESKFDAAGLRALVVDDTPFLRVLTASYLREIGFEIDQAEDGQMAVAMLRSNQYDLLVTDINMPLMDGFELAAEVPSTFHSDIPMVATTTSISSDLEQKCIRAGFFACVPTIDKKRLLKVVSSLQPTTDF